MSKLLRPLVILQLLLSIAAATFAWLLFDKREVLKGRVQNNEAALATIAKNIHDETFRVGDLAVADKPGLEAMKSPLNKLGAAAANLWDGYVFTSNKLDETKTELAQTKEDLNSTKASLEQSQAEVAQLNDKVTQKDAEIAQANSKIQEVEAEKTGLKTQIDDLNTQVAKVEEEKRGLQEDLVTEKQSLAECNAEVARCRGDKPPPMKLGTAGHIVIVNKDWNFVVIDVGADRGGVLNGEMLVHRADKLIGKIRINSMTKTIALADIVNDWQTTPFKEGDRVVF
jgi:hypothetical protein